MKLFEKRIKSKLLLVIIKLKKVFFKNNSIDKNNLVEQIINEYSNKKKIVVLCSGPSTRKVKLSQDCLYLVTNSGYPLVANYDSLYYVNDGYYIKKILALSDNFLNKNQKIVFYYQNSEQHKNGFNFLYHHINLLYKKKLYFITKLINEKRFITNFEQFQTFYENRNLPIKIQNSGIFLLLFGYMLSVKMSLPIELYGLDLGFGGNNHFDNKGLVGKSVTSKQVKRNVSIYLNYFYKEKKDFTNFSYFKPEQYE